jgi:hypothetical protein
LVPFHLFWSVKSGNPDSAKCCGSRVNYRAAHKIGRWVKLRAHSFFYLFRFFIVFFYPASESAETHDISPTAQFRDTGRWPKQKKAATASKKKFRRLKKLFKLVIAG